MVFFANNHPPPPPLQLFLSVLLLAATITAVNGANIFYEWRVAVDTSIKPVSVDQPVITINGMFPGPLINATTNDMINVNVFNDLDEPLLFTWNGIQQRLNSWQDGVTGTNCPIEPGKNWTYQFQVKDQIGSFFYFPSLNFQKAGGGFGPIRVNNRIVINIPFPKPEAEYDLLIGDWYNLSFKDVRSMMSKSSGYHVPPDKMLMNGKGSFKDPSAKSYESFTFTSGKTYRLRISNVGSAWSFNFRIQHHKMVLVETEGSYTSQILIDSLDVHVGQSYSVLVTANQNPADYYIVATPKMIKPDDINNVAAVGVLHYDNSTKNATGPLPSGPDPFDIPFSLNQAKSIRWNLTAGAARPNPQGTFNVTNVTLSQTFILHGSEAKIADKPFYTVNDVSYTTPNTPLKLADQFGNSSDVYQLDQFSTNSSNGSPTHGVFVATGEHKGWIELVFTNDFDVMDSWHLDGFSFFAVGYEIGEWTHQSRYTYNIYDPVVRSTIQVYPKGWTAVYAYLDNPGMWNLRSQNLKNWYLGQELYLRVFDSDPNPAKERPPPDNLLLCGKYISLAPPPPAPTTPTPTAPALPASHASHRKISWFHRTIVLIVAFFYIGKL
ncbi:monocopper oxidase-like protein SKU5 [Jatropha curcas]|uniref:monocopper oxidase-like protein SKU5 n=1 Tax=Jatropha curcas TaxID=180498 RepID=UPI0009D69912|nr:monocopper oxidase-like protein SKU5 [Jatropha curcas]